MLACVMLLALVSCTDVGNDNESSSNVGNESVESDESSSLESEANESEASNSELSEPETDEKEDEDMIFPKESAQIVLANDEVYGWADTYRYGKTDSSPYYRHEDIYYPNPVTFSWEADEKANYYRLFISTDELFAQGTTESFLVNTNSLTLSHLYTGTKYYWFVTATDLTDDGGESNTSSVSTRSFTTAESPRCLKIEGVSNTRDFGGYKTTDGYRLKQGMVYRGGKLEDISEESKEFIRNYLGIKTDFDLREFGEGGAGKVSPLGDDINYINMAGRYYTGGISTDEGKAVMAQEFRVLADPDNYPIYIHCSLGRDRTGTLVMLLQGLLGAKFNDMMIDYELSVFSVTGTMDNVSIEQGRKVIKQTYDYINNNYEGERFRDKVENYLLSIGITEEEIQTIRDLLLEEIK